MTPESPIRRRRPNEKDDTLPRGKTNLELSAEVEKLRDELIKQNIRVELLKKNNHELQAKWLQAKEEAEQLKLLQEENNELRVENRRLNEKLDGLEDYEDQLDELGHEVDKLWFERKAVEEANAALKEEVLNLTKVNNEAVASMQDQQGAFEEAVEMITNLENEKLHLKEEVDDLKGRVAAIESRQVDGSAQYPQRVYSIDEARPATSYDDSDYYSQPATPRADLERDALSIQSGTSVRSKRFIEMSKERTRSTRNLSKRMSDASLRATSVMFTVHAPEVPQIPEEFAQATPQFFDDRFRERRYRQEPNINQRIAAIGEQLHRPATVDPVRTHHTSGLRSLYRSDQLQRSSTPQPLSSHTPSSKSSKSQTHTHSIAEPSPAPPPRMSSRHAHTTSDNRLRPQPSDGTFESNTTTGTLVGSDEQEQEQEQVLTTRISANPCSSTISLLTSPRVDCPDKERWWKDTENVRPLKMTMTMRTLRDDSSSDDGGLELRTFAGDGEDLRVDGIKTSPTAPATKETEKDALFYQNENEEQFMQKTIMKLKGNLRRR